MDPILSWVVCLLSAFLLMAGGYLFARARASRLIEERLGDLDKLRQTATTLLDERGAQEARERQLENQLNAAERALMAREELVASTHGFDGPPQKSDSQSVFERDSVPHLQRVSEDEFEIGAAASRSVKEAFSQADAAGELSGHDETKQFNLHSPENVVQFMQRIDELSEENASIRTQLAEHEQSLKDKRAEANEQIHRYAALDATTQKLRAELKRRNERIELLGDQLKGLLANDDRPLEGPNSAERTPSGSMPPPPPPEVRLTPPPFPPADGRRPVLTPQGLGPPPNVSGPHDGPTLPVQRFTAEDLEEDDK